ncbi:MAG: error-prone DNA polymerase [Ketobacteraceae bacterium]|nr:error-prone DNA polymerase [Ketobacteraceae bacterium]
MSYAELHCYSNFSFLKGASHPEELVKQAASLHYRAIAITDECSLAGIVRAHVACKEHGLKLIVGSEFHTEEGIQFTAYATSRFAYGQLSALISRARRRSPKGQYSLQIRDLKNSLTDCIVIWFPTEQQCNGQHEPVQNFLSVMQGRCWIGVEYHLNQRENVLMLQRESLAQGLNLPTVACGNVHMHCKSRKPLQDALTATRLNTSIHNSGFNLHANSERYLRPQALLKNLYHPVQLEATLQIADQCRFSLDELRYEYPKELVPPHLTASDYLRQLVEDGARQRWPDGMTDSLRQLMEKELTLISELEYEYYFLTVYDIVQFARSENILCQGRGSAANSVVCFCLFITEVDPAKSHLLFERFISKERNEPPDIDVDFEHERREEVIQFIYRKYGRQRAALAATVVTYRIKSAVRDMGKALGFDLSLIDRLSQSIAWWDKKDQFPQRLKDLGIDVNNPSIQQLIILVNQVLGFPRHLSQHVGGFIISSGPLDQMVPIENAAMEERTIVQWDKDDIEALGLLKVDVLALGMLSAIRKSFALLKHLRGTQWTMSTLPQEDPETYQMLQRGDSVGVFQVESRAQMAMLPRLKPRCFYDLVIEVAIVRPGPIQGNMVHPYLKRRNGTEAVEYASEEIRQVLERTLGVPIFQEQVIQLAMVAAGFTAGEADQLRRAMATWKKKGILRQYQTRLAKGLLERGYSLDFANRVIEQINGFGEYGFPESHAASFALLVYVSAWLKCHEPAAFCCGLLNSQPMGFYSPSQLIQDVRRHQVEVRPVDVMHSDWDHTLEADFPLPCDNREQQPAIRLGLRLVKGLSRQGAVRLVQAREQQAFRSLAELKYRARLNQKDLDALAHANALTALSGHRHQARWQVQGIQPESPLVQAEQQQETAVTLPRPDDTQTLIEDYRSIGLTLNAHPMALLRSHPELRGHKTHRDLNELGHKRFVRIAGIVTGRQRPGSAAGVMFITLEDETGNSNIVVWKDLVDRHRAVLLQAQLLKVKGVVEREENVIHVVAGDVEDASHLLGEMKPRSRDFH